MKKRENIEIELNIETLTQLENISKEYNMSFDEVINEILENYISKKILLKDFIKLLLEYKDISELKSFYTIVDDSDNFLFRVKPL
jgi:hypothetical protein